MSQYKRAVQNGGTFFFTVVTHQRKPIFDNELNIEALRTSFKQEMQRRPFTLEAVVVLPDHLHCLWQLPKNDTDFSSRWREIKKSTTKQLTRYCTERKERNVWQKRFWEHKIRDENDWRTHIDYIHYNPVKHGYVVAPRLWRHSSFLKWVKQGAYDIDWGNVEPKNISGLDFE